MPFLGVDPESVDLNLNDGYDFKAVIELTDASDVPIPWPVGTEVYIRFTDGSSWQATISGTEAQWNVDKAVVGAVVASRYSLAYVNGTNDDPLWRGRVIRHG